MLKLNRISLICAIIVSVVLGGNFSSSKYVVSAEDMVESFAPTANTEIRDDMPDADRSTAGYFFCMPNRREAYMRFDISNSEYYLHADQIKLRIKSRLSSGTNPGLQVLKLIGIDKTSWGENTLTWNNAGSLKTAGEAISSYESVVAETWYEADITDYAKEQSDGIVAFRIINHTSGTSQIYSGSSVNKPEISISYSDETLVGLAAEALIIGDTNRITENIKLPLNGDFNTTIAWETSNSDVCTNQGIITRPLPHEQDATVILTATITRGSASAVKQYEIIVLHEPSDNDIVQQVKEELTLDAMTIVSKNFPLVSEGQGGTQISWISQNPEIIRVDTQKNIAIVTRPQGENTKVILTAVVTKNEALAQKEFELTVARGIVSHLALQSVVAGSTQTSGNTFRNAIDGDWLTYWEAKETDSRPYLIVTLPVTTEFNEILLVPRGVDINAYKIECSTDGVKWNEIHLGQTLGFAEEILIPFNEITFAKYIKYTVLEKESGNTGLYMLNVFFNPNDTVAVERALVALQLETDVNNVTGNFDLPQSGDFGVSCSWASNDMDSLKIEGSTAKIIRQKYDRMVTLTVTANKGSHQAVRIFKITVKGTESQSKLNTSGGSGGGSASSWIPIIATVPAKEAERKTIFDDVSDGHWAKGFIEALASEGIIRGVADGKFEPERQITREEFLALLIQAFSLVDETAVSNMNDAEEGTWYYSYIATAQKIGITNGYGENKFGVGQSITRQDMAVLAFRTAQIMNLKLAEVNEIKKFADDEDINEYARESVEKMQIANIINGFDNKLFSPQKYTTRAQAVKIIYLLRMNKI